MLSGLCANSFIPPRSPDPLRFLESDVYSHGCVDTSVMTVLRYDYD